MNVRSAPAVSARKATGAFAVVGQAFAAATVTAALGVPGIAEAQTPQERLCGKRDEVVARLESGYGESRRAYGLQRGDAVVEVFASEATGSWTIIVSSPNGISCLVAAGQNWAATPEEVALGIGEDA